MKETYDREMTTEEKLREAQDYVKRLRKQLNDTDGDAMRYRRMRQLEVVIMAEDGAKYLKGAELDEYIDSLPYARQGGPLRSAQFTEAAKAVLVEAFDSEYAKTHADKLAAHIDAEVMANVKT
jgi:hypothetical protein